jgi:hypothetical protein
MEYFTYYEFEEKYYFKHNFKPLENTNNTIFVCLKNCPTKTRAMRYYVSDMEQTIITYFKDMIELENI